MASNCITDEALAAWASGNAPPELVTSIQEHISTCAACRTVAAEVARTGGARPMPRALGRYELREPICRGGMGTVYSAWDPTVGRQVALKLLHEAAVDGHRAERFRFERQVLASLEHPHIARLLDAGETPEGRPWFAMDFVDGRALDLACDDAKLTPKQRVELMLPVLRAVTAAHQHLVVHRDLKPSNILVDRSGEPRLVDFGIARLLEGASGLTHTGMTPMTPQYASPEQVRREPVSVTSDVYSLGVVLYELLTGVSPYDTKPGDVEALLAAVTAADVKPPSEAVVRATEADLAARGMTREKLSAELRGDLDAIVLMALRKEAQDRYQSVQALTDDLVAALEGRPTLARRGERAYRAALFVRRNRALVATVVALSVGLVATVWQARRAAAERDLAQARFEQVRRLAKAVLFEYHDGIAEFSGSTELRQKLVADAQSYLEALAEQASDDAQLKQELADSYLKLGDVQGDPFAASLGDTTSARASYEKGRALAESVLKTKPNDFDARRTIATSHEKLANLEEMTGKLEDALTMHRTAIELDGQLLAERPDDPEQKAAVARDETAAGQLTMQLGRLEEALKHLDIALVHRRQVAAVREDRKSQRALGVSLISIGAVLAEQGKFTEAIASQLEAEALFTRLSNAHPDISDLRRALGVCRTRLSELFRLTGDNPRAYAYALKIEADARTMYESEPTNAVARRDLVIALDNVISMLNALARYEETGKYQSEAIALSRAAHEADPENLQTLRDLVQLLSNYARNEFHRGRLDEAERLAREQLAVAQTIIDRDGENAAVVEEAAMAHDVLSMLFSKAGDFQKALVENQLMLDGLRAVLEKNDELKRVENRIVISEFMKAELLVHVADRSQKKTDWAAARAVLDDAIADAERLMKEGTSVEALNRLEPDGKKLREQCEAALAGKPLPPIPL